MVGGSFARNKELWIIFGLTLVVGILSVSRDSLWIDEAQSAFPAVQENLAGWWASIIKGHGSEVQMPGYLLLLWIWEKAFGASEYALRSLNMIFLLLAQIAWLTCHALCRSRRLLAAATLTVPMVWAYMNEARPYMMIFAGACLTVSGLLDLSLPDGFQTEAWAPWRYFAGVTLMVGASGLTLPWVALSLVAAWLLSRRKDNDCRWIFPLLLTTSVTLLAVSYNLWAVMIGAQASGVASTSLASLAFASLEISGLSGLGPGRVELRASGTTALAAHLPELLTAAAIVIPSLLISTREALRSLPKRAVLVVGSLSVCSSLGVVLVGVVGGFRVVGRHLMFLVPIVCLMLAVGLARLRSRNRLSAYVLGSGLLAMWIASSLYLRFEARHAHDDYKHAAAVARTAEEEGQVVWWSADAEAALYYGVSLDADEGSSAISVISPRKQVLQTLPPPDIVVLSKPDIYDSRGAIRSYIRTRKMILLARLQAFEIYRSQDPQASYGKLFPGVAARTTPAGRVGFHRGDR